MTLWDRAVAGRQLPRAAAPIIIGGIDIALGLARIHDEHSSSVPQYAAAARVLPISTWGWLTVTVGVLIVGLMRTAAGAYVSSCIAFAFWIVWADLLYQTRHDPRVATGVIVGAVGSALLHALCLPYRRTRVQPGPGV